MVQSDPRMRRGASLLGTGRLRRTEPFGKAQVRTINILFSFNMTHGSQSLVFTSLHWQEEAQGGHGAGKSS